MNPPQVPGLLPTKLFTPVLEPGLVERRRVLELLDAGERARLLLVSAPAGSGKTTLVTNWIRRAGMPVGWVSLDSSDDDPLTFLQYVVEAMGSPGPDACERTRALLGSGSPPEPQVVAGSLVADLIRSEARGVLVLDDLHALSSPGVHELLTLLIERAPATRTNAERLPAWHALNLRVDRRSHFAGSSLTSYLSLTNAYGRDNVRMYVWSPSEEQVKPVLDLGFLPVLGFEYKF